MRHTAVALIIAGLGVISDAAFAADLPPPIAPVSNYRPVVTRFDWTGCYAGVNGGWHRGRDQITTTSSAANFAPGGADFLDSLTPVTYNPNGPTAGVQFGCNGQLGYIVAGLEGDANWMTGTASRTMTVGPNAFIAPGDFLTNQTKAGFLGTARGRVGVAYDRVLVYVTGGAAFGALRLVDTLGTFGGGTVSPVNSSISRTGWTVGGGVEFAFWPNWTAKAEYLYVDLGSFDVPIPCVLACVAVNDTVVHHRYTDNVFRLGVNYLFNYNSAGSY